MATKGATLQKNIIVFDIEACTWNFKADKGFLLCVGYKYLGDSKTTVLEKKKFGDPFDDKELCKRVYDVLADSSVEGYIGHNHKWFDIPFLNTRFLLNGMSPLPQARIFDTCDVMYKKLKMGNSLKNAIWQFKLPSEKTTLDLPGSLRAAMGDKKEMALIVDHCRKDVESTELLYNKLLPLGANGWSMAALSRNKEACPQCGVVGKLVRKGWKVAVSRKSQQFQCMACGGWHCGKAEAL